VEETLLLFDLDETLLRSDKTISERTLNVLRKCRNKGILVGISTSRAQTNAQPFIREIQPDMVVSSGGALINFRNQYIYRAEFTADETRCFIENARKICGEDVEITIDTVEKHYWNYKTDPNTYDPTWGETIFTDYTDFYKPSLKICVEIPKAELAEQLLQECPECDHAKFVGSNWYKFTKKTATKELAIKHLCEKLDITPAAITAFGDDVPDIGMLKLCGIGIAMGNASEEVKKAADIVIGGNDEDGIAEYLEGIL